MFSELNDQNFLLYAVKAYDRPNCILSEFEEDLQRIKYIKRLLKRYKQTGTLKERLILNHIIILTNVFGVEPTIRMLFFKIDQEDYSELKTFLLFLNHNPAVIKGVNGTDIDVSLIPPNLEVGSNLRKI